MLFLFCSLAIVDTKANNSAGESTFKSKCGICHKVGGGKLVGPDLKDVGKRREKAWLTKWIKSSQALIKSGDTAAVGVFERYSKVPMPDQDLSEADIDAVLAYIETASAGGAVKAFAKADHEICNPETHKKSQGANYSILKGMGFSNYIMFFILLLLFVIVFVGYLGLKTSKEEIKYNVHHNQKQ